MRSIRQSGPIVVALVLTAGAFSACSSSSSSGAGGSGAGGTVVGTGGHGTGGAVAGTGGAVAGIGGSVGTGGSQGTGGSTTDGGGDTRADVMTVIDGSQNDVMPSITVTSPSLTAGAMFAATNTCAGVNTSPQLTWTAGPAGTMSYAVSLTDVTNGAVHWIIWDIPAATTTLPAALPAGSPLTTPVVAKQLHYTTFFGAGTDYRGPCPNGTTHDYRFQVSAVNVATLGGVTGASSTLDVQNLAHAAALAIGSLNGTSNARTAPADAGDASGQ